MKEQLPLEVPERWTVEPIFHRQTKAESSSGQPKVVKHYALIYRTIVQKKAIGERATERLREMAAFCNKRGLVPRPAVQCFADTNIPPLPKQPKVKPLTSPEAALP